jgi:hypothetical protein
MQRMDRFTLLSWNVLCCKHRPVPPNSEPRNTQQEPHTPRNRQTAGLETAEACHPESMPELKLERPCAATTNTPPSRNHRMHRPRHQSVPLHPGTLGPSSQRIRTVLRSSQEKLTP